MAFLTHIECSVCKEPTDCLQPCKRTDCPIPPIDLKGAWDEARRDAAPSEDKK